MATEDDVIVIVTSHFCYPQSTFRGKIFISFGEIKGNVIFYITFFFFGSQQNFRCYVWAVNYYTVQIMMQA